MRHCNCSLAVLAVLPGAVEPAPGRPRALPPGRTRSSIEVGMQAWQCQVPREPHIPAGGPELPGQCLQTSKCPAAAARGRGHAWRAVGHGRDGHTFDQGLAAARRREGGATELQPLHSRLACHTYPPTHLPAPCPPCPCPLPPVTCPLPSHSNRPTSPTRWAARTCPPSLRWWPPWMPRPRATRPAC